MIRFILAWRVAFKTFRDALRTGNLVRIACSFVLFVAALFKGYAIATNMRFEQQVSGASSNVLNSVWLQLLLINYEILLAGALLYSANAVWPRRIAIVTFLGFTAMTAVYSVGGVASCGCFGQVRINPMSAMFWDLLATVSLVLWKPKIVRSFERPELR